MAGEQFALPEAVGLLRAMRRDKALGQDIVISAADPLNLVGISTPEPERVPASHRNRVLYRDGTAVAALEGGRVRLLAGHSGESEESLRRLLVRSTTVRDLRPYLQTRNAKASA
jgi:ATP-dependent Lhr-like helicase